MPGPRPERGDVERRLVGVGALAAVAADVAVDQPGVAGQQRLVVEARRRRAEARTLVTNTSAASSSSSATSRSSGVVRSSTMLRLLRLSSSKTGFVGRSPPIIAPNPRAGSPSGGSILTTSAPQSASTPPAAGPAIHTPSSMTLTPSIGPGMALPCLGPRPVGGPNGCSRGPDVSGCRRRHRPAPVDRRGAAAHCSSRHGLAVGDLAALDHRPASRQRRARAPRCPRPRREATAGRDPLVVGVGGGEERDPLGHRAGAHEQLERRVRRRRRADSSSASRRSGPLRVSPSRAGRSLDQHPVGVPVDERRASTGGTARRRAGVVEDLARYRGREPRAPPAPTCRSAAVVERRLARRPYQLVRQPPRSVEVPGHPLVCCQVHLPPRGSSGWHRPHTIPGRSHAPARWTSAGTAASSSSPRAPGESAAAARPHGRRARAAAVRPSERSAMQRRDRLPAGHARRADQPLETPGRLQRHVAVLAARGAPRAWCAAWPGRRRSSAGLGGSMTSST